MRIAGGGLGDLLRPAVDPSLNLRDVPLGEQGRDGVGVVHALGGVAKDDQPLVTHRRRRLRAARPPVDRVIGRARKVEGGQPVEVRIGVLGKEHETRCPLIIEVEVVIPAVIAVRVVEQRLRPPGGERARQVDDRCQ